MGKWSLPILAGSWFMASPLLWDQSGLATAVALIGGVLIVVLSTGSVLVNALEPWAATLGATLAIWGLVDTGPRMTAVNRMIVGLAVLVGAVLPQPRVLARQEVLDH